MKITFKNLRDIRKGKDYVTATVTVVKSRLFHQPVESNAEIYRHKWSQYWRYMETGGYTPDFEAENLYDIWLVKQDVEKGE